MELLPLPVPSTQHWLYARHSKLHWLADREMYVRFQAPRRARRIGKEIDRYKPKVVVFYGLTFEEFRGILDRTQFAGTQFAETAIKDFSIARRDGTLFAVVPHPVARCLSRD